MGIIKRSLKKIKSIFVVEKLTAISTPILEGNLLVNQTAFISGGTGGIGAAIAKRFIANGARVVIAGRDEEKLKRVCSALGENATYVVLDITEPKQFDGVIEEASRKTRNRIDILVNCAGTHGPSDFWAVTPENWDAVMGTNLKGLYFLSQSFGNYYRTNNIRGHILNISSASALKLGKTPYEISKNGVEAVTRGLASEMIKYGIVVNGLAPGPTATGMLHMDTASSLHWPGNPSGRVATPEEIANWAVMLVSDMGNYVVGDSFYVTGGSGTICIDK